MLYVLFGILILLLDREKNGFHRLFLGLFKDFLNHNVMQIYTKPKHLEPFDNSKSRLRFLGFFDKDLFTFSVSSLCYFILVFLF